VRDGTQGGARASLALGYFLATLLPASREAGRGEAGECGGADRFPASGVAYPSDPSVTHG
jgi:hypothetical protein